jgi:hypothetical protein
MRGISANKLLKCVLNRTYPSLNGIVMTFGGLTQGELTFLDCAVQQSSCALRVHVRLVGKLMSGELIVTLRLLDGS